MNNINDLLARYNLKTTDPIQSNNSGPFNIVGLYNYRYINSKKYYDVVVHFINTGYYGVYRLDAAIAGEIKDPFAPSVAGIGYLGLANPIEFHREYKEWESMIYRCKRKKDTAYKNYGEKGVDICERWLCFEYFLEDIKKLPGYGNWYAANNGSWQLDKDIIQFELETKDRIYSPETCMFVSKTDNIQAKINDNQKNKTGYVGVIKNKHAKVFPTWISRIKKDGKIIAEDYYYNPEAAAVMRDYHARMNGIREYNTFVNMSIDQAIMYQTNYTIKPKLINPIDNTKPIPLYNNSTNKPKLYKLINKSNNINSKIDLISDQINKANAFNK